MAHFRFLNYVFIAKCLKLSDLLNKLCHHIAFSLSDVFVDIGKSLWVVIAVIVAHKELHAVDQENIKTIALPERIVVSVDESIIA